VSAAAPWSVKGIDPKAREIAKDLARRSGMTLGEWLNSMIMEDGEEDEGYTTLPRRPHAADIFERRGRSRRLDDAYGAGEDVIQRLSASVDAIAARLEAAERRSTVAVQGIDQAVAGLVRRLEASDQDGRQHGRRIDDIAEELREGHRRLRKFENEVGPKTTETFGKVETGLGALAGRLYDIEERQRSGVNELRQRMDAVEKLAGPGAGSDLLGQVSARLDQAQARTTEALRGLERSFAHLDQRLRTAENRVEPEGAREAARFEKLAETLARQVDANRAEMMRRLDTAETGNRMDRIERAVQALGEQLKTSETRSAGAVEAMGREVLRIAENLNGRVGRIEADASTRFEKLGEALTRKVEGDMGRLAQGLEQRLTAADDRHALAIEKLGGEITRISDRLSERIAQSERRSQQALDDIGRRLADSSTRIEQRYDRASGELAERMRLSEERTAALIAEARENIERRAEAGKTEPVAAPVAEAQPDAQPDWRAAAFPDAAFPDAPFQGQTFDDPDPVYAEQQAWSADLAPPEPEFAPEPSVADAVDTHEVLTADAVFDAVMRGPRTAPEPSSTPFGSREAVAEPFAAFEDEIEAPLTPVFTTPPAAAASAPFGHSFGGADVSDALAATAPEAFDAGPDDFAAETDFVDPRALRAAAAQGRAANSTRQAIDAARAAMSEGEEAPARTGFGLKRGGKSRLQERLDKQASKQGGTVRKALGASAVAVVLTATGAVAFSELTDAGIHIPGLPGAEPAAPVAALAATPVEASPADRARAADLYQQAIIKLDADDVAGLESLREAAELGYAPAQVYIATLYETGQKGLPVDLPKARAWTQRAANAGNPRAMFAYGMHLFQGTGGSQNIDEGMLWLTKAAEAGVVDSQFNLGQLYETGEGGVRVDPVDAYKWYLIASRAGDTDARDAVDRLRAVLSVADRGKARADADRFTVEPIS
jgi:localization factor PodJL